MTPIKVLRAQAPARAQTLAGAESPREPRCHTPAKRRCAISSSAGKINVAEFIAWLSDSKEEAAGGTCSAVNRGIEITEAIDKFAARLRLTLEKQEKFNLECQGEWASQYDIFIHWDNPKPETIRLLEFDKSIKAEIVACMPVYADHNAVKEMNDLKFDHKWAREHAGNAQKAL